MTSVRLLLNGKEFFSIKSITFNYSLNKSIGIKSASITAISGTNFRNFLLDLEMKKVLLGRLIINNKIYLEGFINDKLIHYTDSAESGTIINIRIMDRFVGIIGSDIISSRPTGNLQNFLSDILTELGYVSDFVIDTYQRKIKSPLDFLRNKNGFDSTKPLIASKRASLVEENSFDLLGETLNVNKAILMSNGYDTLTFEEPNLLGTPVFRCFRYVSKSKQSNYNSIEKYGEMGDASSLTPSLVVTLNSYSKQSKKDNNTSVISPNPYGIPHIIKVHRLNSESSYEEIQSMMDFSFAGIKARSDSFVIRLKNIAFDSNNDFFTPNKTVTIFDEKFAINRDMIILDASTTIDSESGTDTTLNVTYKESFEDNISIKKKGRITK